MAKKAGAKKSAPKKAMSAQPAAKASRPRYKMRVEDDVYVAMPDGVRIACRIYRPDADGQFPTLYAASPYQYEYDHVPALPLFPWKETGPIEFYVSRGYVYIHADVRGSGRSEGQYEFLSTTEQMDSYHMIEWIAAQPWSNGRVGGIGQSYFGFSQWLMAVNRPPHLTCIAPYDALVDPYRCHGFHGGVYCSYRTMWYIGLRSNALHRPPDQRRGKDMVTDLGRDLTFHDTDDSWWKERSAFERIDRINIPVLSIGHWAKKALHLRGNVVGFEYTPTKDKKLVITNFRTQNEVHHAFDTEAFHEKWLLPFYDRYLHGLQNGYEKLPAVRLGIQGADNLWREESEWPLKRAKMVPFYLRKKKSGSLTSLNDGSLTTAAPARNEGETSYRYPDNQWVNGVVAMGPNGPDPIKRVLTWTSTPLDEDLEVVGPIVMELWASSSETDTEFFVKLADQFPQSLDDRKAGAQPRSFNVSKGWLKASHHFTKNEKKSTPYRPFYDHDNPKPLDKNMPYKFEIEVLPAGYLFKKGHRIRVELVNGDSSITDTAWTHPYHPSKIGRDTIYHSGARASRILLPVVPRGRG
jgi:putative CocE/NonD family hydrolase